MRRTLFLYVVISLVCAYSCLDLTCINVSNAGNDTKADGSLKYPFGTIQAAILAMKNDSQKICLADGIYNNTVDLNSTVVKFAVLIEGTPSGNAIIGTSESGTISWILNGIPFSMISVTVAFVDLYGPLVLLQNCVAFGSFYVESKQTVTLLNSTLDIQGIFDAPQIVITNCSLEGLGIYSSVFMQVDGEIVISNTSVSSTVNVVNCGTMLVENSSFTRPASLILTECSQLVIESCSFLNNSKPYLVNQVGGTTVIKNSVFKWNEGVKSLVRSDNLIVDGSSFGCNDWFGWVSQNPLEYTYLNQSNNTFDIQNCPWLCSYHSYRPFELSKCLSCGPGEASLSNVSTSCSVCSSGTYPDPFDFGCAGCYPGFYTANYTCNLCPGGSYQDKMNQTSCKSCPAGTEPSLSRSSCTTCSPGFYSEGGAEFCSLCGFFQTPSSDQSSCVADTQTIGIIVGVSGGAGVCAAVGLGIFSYIKKRAKRREESERLIQ